MLENIDPTPPFCIEKLEALTDRLKLDIGKLMVYHFLERFFES